MLMFIRVRSTTRIAVLNPINEQPQDGIDEPLLNPLLGCARSGVALLPRVDS